MEIPKEWPTEVSNIYSPIRVLGKGGFASVVLARDKNDSKTKVAVKVVGSSSEDVGNVEAEKKTAAYAQREIEILRRLDHENIVKVINYWDLLEGKEDRPKNNAICVIALSYAKGPTVESLLQHGGALSNVFGRVVLAQVVDTVAYMHYRGVLHRDIKPDNIMITGAVSKDDEIWDNEDPSSKSKNWDEKRGKWKVTLIDFGFARALKEKDIINPSKEIHQENKRASFRNLDDSAKTESTNEDTNESSSRGRGTLGNRNFAAPEIINKVKHATSEEKEGGISSVTETISEYVADYGLLVDSYSMGHTIRYCMTGVMPGESVEAAISTQNSFCFKLCGGNKKDQGKRSVHYRLTSELSEELQDLIKNLTEVSEKKRVSIRKARRSSPWINDVLLGVKSEEQEHFLSEKSYLEF
ncbi:kinase-like protein [Fragilariopsis cylindrus CCMP1102]|uniref:Kinase-like protein n=1 Tax=Fragilariopsis cylindrus CCMP1102 TaxID=635003 RepID=A0A1E7FH40_9STRA|nr:kinase-like protein [Fragilariopsis cylindrus CCMP1102]|eukprot:OEU17491.1 kinase-like protein [Fragilariopsis cylindrus CCMP1102]